MSGCASTRRMSPEILSTTGFGVAAGAKNANHVASSKPGRPDSAIVGRSGASGERVAVVTASPRSLPALMWGSAVGRLSNIRSTCPPSRSVIAGPAPRYGMCSMYVLAHALHQLGRQMLRRAVAARCIDELGGILFREVDQFLDARRPAATGCTDQRQRRRARPASAERNPSPRHTGALDTAQDLRRALFASRSAACSHPAGSSRPSRRRSHRWRRRGFRRRLPAPTSRSAFAPSGAR